MLKDKAVIGSGVAFATDALGYLPAKKTIFISDEKIWQNCREFFPDNFDKNFTKLLLLQNPKADEVTLGIIEKELQGAELIICLGSGTINDLCKFSAAQNGIPYAVFASATSMNGYLSKNASITINGHKKTLPATLPDKVFCNLDILKSAPLELLKAGVGDSFCFYSCYFDWYLSHKMLGTEFNRDPFEILQPKMDFLRENYSKFSLRDEEFLHLLVEILLLSGIGMTIAGGSYPASQSEHMIAHTIDMKYPKRFENLLHGQVIAVTTLRSARLQNELLNSRFRQESQAENLTDIHEFFPNEIAVECLKEYEEKLLLMKKIKKLDEETLNELRRIHLSESSLKDIFTHFEINSSVESLGFSDEEYQNCVMMARFTRNRFTCLDLAAQNVA
jgi:glycerol-1-phosphate dehydrogenase [NAD(P)+]